jgi:hypothetical protein
VTFDDTPASAPPTEADLDRIEEMLSRHPADHVVRVADIAPLVMRLVAEVRRLLAENRSLSNRARES